MALVEFEGVTYPMPEALAAYRQFRIDHDADLTQAKYERQTAFYNAIVKVDMKSKGLPCRMNGAGRGHVPDRFDEIMAKAKARVATEAF